MNISDTAPDMCFAPLVLDSLLDGAPDIATKLTFQPAPLESFAFKTKEDLCIVADALRKEQLAVLEKHQEVSEKIKKLNKYIEVTNENGENIKKDLSLTSKEYKLAAKPLVKAIKKYSTSLDMHISIQKHEIEQLFVAAVRFSTKPQSKPINFIIDLKNRNILDFDAHTAMGPEEATKFKQQAKTEDGWDIDVVLMKLRECCN